MVIEYSVAHIVQLLASFRGDRQPLEQERAGGERAVQHIELVGTHVEIERSFHKYIMEQPDTERVCSSECVSVC